MHKKHLYFKKGGNLVVNLVNVQVKAYLLTLLNTKVQAEIELEKESFPLRRKSPEVCWVLEVSRHPLTRVMT